MITGNFVVSVSLRVQGASDTSQHPSINPAIEANTQNDG
jgi:hypothetical protein